MKVLRIFSLTVISILLTQCYPKGPEYIDQLDVVLSNYDPAYDFSAKHTFAIPDKILKIDEGLINGGLPNFVAEPYATQLLNTINSNMTAYGWQKVATTANPNVFLTPVAYELTNYTYWGWGGYWDWWYGGWWGWYYPYYPYYTMYTTGSLIINMADPSDLSADGKARSVWTFIINGLLEGGSANVTARFTKGVDQAFKQSPYLKK